MKFFSIDDRITIDLLAGLLEEEPESSYIVKVFMAKRYNHWEIINENTVTLCSWNKDQKSIVYPEKIQI